MESPLARYFNENGNRRGIQLALAKKARLSEATISRYASGSRKPGLAHALKIERATGGAVGASDWSHLRSLFGVLRRRERVA